jgi:hypothetical protein
MNREQIVRDAAYAIWEKEGRPEGRAEAHWRQAEELVALHWTPENPNPVPSSEKKTARANVANKDRTASPMRSRAKEKEE